MLNSKNQACLILMINHTMILQRNLKSFMCVVHFFLKNRTARSSDAIVALAFGLPNL